MIRKLLAAAAASALLVAAPLPASAASVGDARVYHSTASVRSSILVAKDWCGTPSDPGPCEGTERRWLARGVSTTYWSDADGVRVEPWCEAWFSAPGVATQVWRANSTAKWIKVSGLWGGTWTVTVKGC